MAYRRSSWQYACYAVQMLAHDEGERLKPYKDSVGKLTIGYGRNLEDCGISRDEAKYMLENDIDRCRAFAISVFTPEWFDSIHEIRQLAIVNMIYNMGEGRFLSFKNTIAAMKAENWELAAKELLFNKQANRELEKTPYYRVVGPRGERVAIMLKDAVFPY